MSCKFRYKLVKIFEVVITLLALLFLVLQAVSSLQKGQWFASENYFGQPVGPGIQLVVVAVLVFVLIMEAIQYFKKNKTKDRKKRRQKNVASWPNRPPYRWPWE